MFPPRETLPPTAQAPLAPLTPVFPDLTFTTEPPSGISLALGPEPSSQYARKKLSPQIGPKLLIYCCFHDRTRLSMVELKVLSVRNSPRIGPQ